jgi:hypothetical protein
VYTIDSKNTYQNAFELFDPQKNENETLDFDEIDFKERWKFILDNKDKNSQCLIYYLKEHHGKQFSPKDNYEEEDTFGEE